MIRDLSLLCAAFAVVASLPAATAAAKAKPGRYVVDAKGETVLDNATKLTWQRVVPGQTYTWQGAKDYCKSLPLAGGGWKLPSVRQLRSIVDRAQKSAPTIDPTAFPNTPSEYFWTAVAYQGGSSIAWFVYFYNGYSSSHGVANNYRVRCVR